jgi:hypothetical protein
MLMELYASDVMEAKLTKRGFPAEDAMALVCSTPNSIVT